ncbi:PstS family phosphate ABC transporter substrate-binding protein [endosymbiont of Ridgeia piscesae]|uniref:Phosphate ABC transporter substrate-binding protein, PhoT family n=1 Tax=endosymbiont of Ridgeia piscesae TaxID=54398 RepID=A0A0T5Z3G9_9GAMM|nr:PstS family phosphate ABC transporter substrate-binding protein [endosymbiont of Ridgeia piscesae]KRT53560.1 phosphate ABC transporter substrate-binding protein, PhoT family [endosymbiont of Ridgeia piscesae]KRT57481.1 phosphate ABC transporter substrate-binding protein, PhoT family [endosymbiont of Ridgeia piscesae]
MINKRFALAALLAASASVATAAASRDYISIVGSSTVYPFATVVAETFGKTSSFKTPKIESTGSGGGLKLFCAGVGVEHPDITNASRRIKKSEVERCTKQGVNDIVEVKIGYDGIAIANSKHAAQFELTRRDLFLALAKQVPGPDGKLIDNPNKTWKEVNPALPNTKIEVLGPPPTSGTRDAFADLVMGTGATTFSDLKALHKAKGEEQVKPLMAKLGIPERAYNKKGKKVFKAVAHAIREDGAYIEAGENDNLIVQKLEANPNALGVFGFSFLDQNSDKVQGSKIEGVAPEFESIADGSYPVSRPLFFYVKKAHIGKIPGISEYLSEFTSEKAWGDEGYLADKGMIPMPKAERNAFASDVRSLKNLQLK